MSSLSSLWTNTSSLLQWFAKNGKTDTVLDVIAKFHANGQRNDPLVEFEFRQIGEALREEEENLQVSYLDYLRTPGNRWRLMIIVSIAVGSN